VSCKNYYKASEVTARFSADKLNIVITFSKAAISFSSSICSTFINAASLTKLGTNPVCTWNSARTTLNIKLGTSSTITNEALSIKELIVIAAGSNCNYSPETLAPVISSSVAKVEDQEDILVNILTLRKKKIVKIAK